MKGSRRSRGLLVAGTAVLAAGVAVAAVWIWNPGVLYGIFDGGSGTGGTYSQFIFDIEDKSKLVAWADDVFVGRVVEQSGKGLIPDSKPGTEGDMPYTLYRVEVIRSLKGPLSGYVEFRQDGSDGRLLDGDPMLKPGERCLFVTKGSYDPSIVASQTTDGQPAPGRPRVVNAYGDIRLRSDADEVRVRKQFESALASQAQE